MRLRRSLLFVPGAEPRKLEKARLAPADTLLLDLEDSVAPPQKAEARANVAAWRRILPARKDRLVHLDLPPIGTAPAVAAAMSAIFRAIGEGQITPGEGEMMANILATQTNVFLAEDFERRLENVERVLAPGEQRR